jgi:hypothetical protein
MKPTYSRYLRALMQTAEKSGWRPIGLDIGKTTPERHRKG